MYRKPPAVLKGKLLQLPNWLPELPVIYAQYDKQINYWLWQVNSLQGSMSVKELSRKANISERQLGRRFNDAVGLSPKEYLRVCRFIHSLANLKKYPGISLTNIAYESGYYDQAHFIHDCREYAGCTPRELVSSNSFLY